MKAGIVFDTVQEAKDKLQYDFIAAVWNHVSTFSGLQLTEKIRLKECGFTEDEVNALMPLVKIAKKWSWRGGHPTRTVFTPEDILQWRKLYDISLILHQWDLKKREMYGK